MPEPRVTQPKLFSVITVVYNDVRNLHRTIISVLDQDHLSYEYIIIDGGSEDGTLALIQKYGSKIKVLSEHDNGLYDAMNKGIDLASGEYVIFLNAGDCFANSSVLSRVALSIGTERPDCVYGNNHIKLTDGSLAVRKAEHNLSKMWKMPCSHQALFTKTELAKRYRFDLSYSISADYCMVVRLYRNSHSFLHCDIPISIFETGGVSDDRRVRMVWERFQINRKYNSYPHIYLALPILLTSAFLKQTLKRTISRNRYERIKKVLARKSKPSETYSE